MTNPSARPNPPRPPLDDPRVGIRTKLSALWVAVMFLYVYVDIFSFYEPGTIDGILIGRVWTLDITQGWALGALALMAVPTLMLVLSLTLPAAAARWTNVVVASLFVIVSFANAVGETWLYLWLGAAVEVVVLLLVVRYAWTWPRRPERAIAPVETRRPPRAGHPLTSTSTCHAPRPPDAQASGRTRRARPDGGRSGVEQNLQAIEAPLLQRAPRGEPRARRQMLPVSTAPARS